MMATGDVESQGSEVDQRVENCKRMSNFIAGAKV